jgi:Protein of unknown function (DUF2628)
MSIFAVHCAADPRAPEAALERARLLRQGFVWPALLLGPLWLALRGLWRPLALWVVAAALTGVAAQQGFIGPGGAVSLYLLSAFYLGVEGRALQGAALARGGRPLADIVSAGDRYGAECAFFARALSAPPPRPPEAASGAPAGGSPQVLGLFPEAGG